MELKDYSSVSTRVKRLKRVNVALGIIISFLDDLVPLVKSPTRKFFQGALIPHLHMLRAKVKSELSFLINLKINK